jgi:aminoglycoside phosphotransferase (APT) family kinase protein
VIAVSIARRSQERKDMPMPTTDPVAQPTGSSAAVLEVLRHRLDRPDLAYAAPPEPLKGGFYAEIIAFRLTGAPTELSGDLVVRIMPDTKGGRRESIVQREVGDQGFAVPRVRLVGGPDEGLGRPYVVMDRVGGQSLLNDLSSSGALLAMPRALRRLPPVLAATAVELHRLDPEPLADELRREVPDLWVDSRQLLEHYAAQVDALDDGLLHDSIDWLRASYREPTRRVICHGDLHPFNVLVDGDRRVVLDWTNGTIADPAFELAFTMSTMRHAPIEVPSVARPLARRATRWLADRTLRDYRKAAEPYGIEVDPGQLAWHNVFMAMRMVCELEGWREAGQLGEHEGHPFLLMEAGLRDDIRTITRVR